MKQYKLIVFQLILILICSLVLLSCATTRPATDAVIHPSDLLCQRCKPLQVRYWNDLLSLSKRVPFDMKVNTMGFIDWKDSTYFSIQLVGAHYNTIRTTITTRLTSEFHEKYQETMRLILKENFINEIDGVHIVLICSSSNFVTKKERQSNTLEIIARTAIIKQFLNNDITAQDLLDRSVVFIDAQRTRFMLEMM